jgi:hypothetical protein
VAHELQQQSKQKDTGRAVTAAGSWGGAATREPSRAVASPRQWSEPPRPPTSKSPSQNLSGSNPRKHGRSPSVHADRGRPLIGYSSSPSAAQQTPSPSTRISAEERDKNVDEYIAPQNEEEELDRKIVEAETERADYQSRLNKAINQKAKLMEEKEKVKAEKQRLQSSLDANEALEFGYEAGRRSMENKRARRE